MSAVLPNGVPDSNVETSLAQSRDRMRAFLQGESSKSAAGTHARTPHPIGLSLLDAMRVWLRGQPWVGVARLGTQATRQALAPVANRHPLALVGAAAVVGGLLTWLRPWRGLLRPALLAGIGSQMASRLIARVPVERLLDGAFDLFSPESRSRTAQVPPSQRVR